MMYRVFKNEIKDPENIVMKYTDNGKTQLVTSKYKNERPDSLLL